MTDTHRSDRETLDAIGALRKSQRLMRTVAACVSLAFVMLILAPTAVAARVQIEKRNQRAALQASDEAEFSRTLRRIEERIERLETKLARGEDGNSEQAQIKQLENGLRQLERSIRRNLDTLGSWIGDQGLDPLIAQRQQQAVSDFETRLAQLYAKLSALEAAGDTNERLGKARDALQWLEDHGSRRTPPSFDPNDLSNKAHKADKGNRPRLTPDAFARAGLHNNPYPRLAALGAFTFDALPGANDPAYLAGTPEIVLTQSIRDQAAELEHDPVRIYHWVRNHIEWLPTWGAWQDAALTLSAKRGNALDIAGLTIALLRASGIPARYAHGTIEMPVERFTNWVGDFADIDAAWEYASVGGIPTTAVTSGGAITKMRLEHVWVEAAIDFVPSRGARNRAADTWVALDPSYKQYAYLQGLDVIDIAGIDPEQLAQSFVDSGSVNEAESWVTGFDPAVLEGARSQAQQALEAYIQNHLTDPTVGEVIGGRKTIVQEYPVLPSGLPYKTLFTGARYASLPDPLRHRMRLAFQKDILGDLIDPVTYPWAQLNNQRLTLSFRPATRADEEALQALLPDGEITDIGQLPQSIPAYLIQVIPELKLDGQVIKSGSPMKLGEELPFTFQTLHPTETQSPYTYPVIAGSYLAIAVFGQNVSPEILEATQQRLTQTKAALESQDPTLIGSLTREELLGELFHAGTLGYFAQYNALAHIAALNQRASHNLSLGYGSYGYEPNVDSFFGIPRAIEPGGVAMNVRIGRYLGTHTNDAEQKKQLNIQTGILSSALEHAVPEQMFVTEENPGEAVSAVKALAKANAQGQRIYHITQANQGATLG